MARKSDGEKIGELMIAVAVLGERMNSIYEQVQELKQDLRESRQRLWLLVPPLVAALVSAGLMAVVNHFLTRR
ncbi:MAG TPA: hypothetical protein VMF69_25005 [Gemmataceae bacterium]|nr:hypothetical protein [Gemmataceae bacterium]